MCRLPGNSVRQIKITRGKYDQMGYSPMWLGAIAVALFSAGTWVEWFDPKPTVLGACNTGSAFVVCGAGFWVFNNLLGPLG